MSGYVMPLVIMPSFAQDLILRLNGEFVPGTESWFSFGYLKQKKIPTIELISLTHRSKVKVWNLVSRLHAEYSLV